MRLCFNNSTYIVWFLLGCFHAAIIYFVPLYTFVDSGIMWGNHDNDGKTGDLWTMSLCSYTSIIFVVNLKLLLGSRSLTLVHFIAISVTSIGLYFLWMWVSDNVVYQVQNTVSDSHKSPLFYLSMICAVGGCFIGDFFVKALNFVIWPSPSEYLRYLVSNRLSVDEPEHRDTL